MKKLCFAESVIPGVPSEDKPRKDDDDDSDSDSGRSLLLCIQRARKNRVNKFVRTGSAFCLQKMSALILISHGEVILLGKSSSRCSRQSHLRELLLLSCEPLHPSLGVAGLFQADEKV